jgi:dolichol-phosphate mannosyltransferase
MSEQTATVAAIRHPTPVQPDRDTWSAARSQRANLSVVAPCFNEQEVLPEFLRRVRAVVEELGMAIEIVLVDDGSRDGTWPIIAAAASDDTRILGIRLRRNHGHQTALSAGLAAARGELVLLIDAD